MSDYTPSGAPVTSSSGSSSAIRAEFALIQAAIASKADSAGPTLTTPALGAATATSINKITLTQPATGATLTLTDGKTLSVAKTLTLTGTDGTTMTFPATSASVARIDAAQTFTGIQDFDGRIDANAGLAVTGANFTSRGITDSATATALTLSGSGANSVTIANSATNPTIGTSAGSLAISPAGLPSVLFSANAAAVNYFQFVGQPTGSGINLQAAGTDTNVSMVILSKGTGEILFYANGANQARILSIAGADRYLIFAGSNGGNPTIGTSAGSLALSAAVVAASTVTVGSNLFANGYAQVNSDDATPAGGAVNTGLFLGVSAIGIYFGSGAPTVSAAQGSLYIRTDGGASTRLYSNNNGTTGWSAITSA